MSQSADFFEIHVTVYVLFSCPGALFVCINWDIVQTSADWKMQ